MITLILLLIIGLTLWGLALAQAALWVWAAVLALPLLVANQIAPEAWVFDVFWLLCLACALFSIKPMRYLLWSKPLMRWYQRLLPPISRTEREALEAGEVDWDAELFSGQPHWHSFLQRPIPPLTEEEQDFLTGSTEQLCALLNEWHITHELNDLPPEVWQFLRQHGFFGLIIPKQYGGKGFSAAAHSAIISKIGSRSATAGVTVMVPNSLGPAELLLHYGTETQKNYYLPRLAQGQELPCFALTNQYAGSDAAAIPDYGLVCWGEDNGERVLGMRVTWQKRYITLAPVATLLGLAFHLYDSEHLLSEETDIGITLALIPTNYAGVHIGRRHFPAHQAFQNGPTWGESVFIPMRMVIGEQAYLGQGWRMLMNCLAAGRAISLPAMSAATAQMCARFTGAYARIRKQFKVPIGQFEGVAEALTRIAAQAYQLEATRQVTNAILDQGIAPPVISAMFKYRATQGMRESLNDAMDIHGGKAVCDGPSNYLFGAYQSIPVAITVEGANILTRSLISFGQGALRCHPWLLAEMHAVQLPPDQALPAFDRAIAGHVQFSLNTAARALLHNLTRGLLISTPSEAAPNMHSFYRQLTRACTNFALVSDVALLLLGGRLKVKEQLSGRFADIFSELYILSCTLKRYHHDGNCAADRSIVKWVMVTGLYKIQSHLDSILTNFPLPWAGRALRWLVFPLGLTHRPADDYLGQAVAQLLLSPSIVRDRLTPLVYLSSDPDDRTGCLEHALLLTLNTEPILKRLQLALHKGELARVPWHSELEFYQHAHTQGALSQTELEQLTALTKAVQRVIMVDDFAPEQLNACLKP